jgi:hypothetical protein
MKPTDLEKVKVINHRRNRITKDTYSGRLHSWLTAIPSESRQYITWHGEKTLLLDVKNMVAFSLLPYLRKVDESEYAEWSKLAKNGLYEHLVDECNFVDREHSKDTFNCWVGGSQSRLAQRIDKWVKNNFPKFHRIFHLKQTRENRKDIWAELTQKVDVKFIVDGLVLNPNKGFDCIGIHDAILIKETALNVALDALKESIMEVVGVLPVIDIERPTPVEETKLDRTQPKTFTKPTFHKHSSHSSRLQETHPTPRSKDSDANRWAHIIAINNQGSSPSKVNPVRGYRSKNISDAIPSWGN